MEQVIFQVALAVIAILSSLVTYVLIPYIKKKNTAQDFERIKKWVNVSVAAAQQLYKVIGGDFDRKQYVVEFLKAMGVTLSNEQINVLIEAAVFELNQIMLEVQDDTPETQSA